MFKQLRRRLADAPQGLADLVPGPQVGLAPNDQDGIGPVQEEVGILDGLAPGVEGGDLGGMLFDDLEQDELFEADPDGVSWTRQHGTKELSPENETLRSPLGAARRGLQAKEEKEAAKAKIKKKRKKVRKETRRVEAVLAESGELTPLQEQLIEDAGWPLSATAVSLDARLKDGPGLHPDELFAIDELSQTDAGEIWLSAAGLFSTVRALDFLHAGRFHEWLLLEPNTRVQLATMAYEEGIGDAPPSPAFTLGRHFVLSTGIDEEERAMAEEGRDHDVRNAFIDTLASEEMTDEAAFAISEGAVVRPDKAKVGVATGWMKKKVGMAKGKKRDVDALEDRNRSANAILEKVLVVLQAGLQLYDADAGAHVEPDQSTDVCRALAHGGRVNIRIPAMSDGEDGQELLRFLGLYDEDNHKSDAIFERGFGTHRMKIEDNGPDGEQGAFIEEGGKGAASRAAKKSVKPGGESKPILFGMNVAAGGLGNLDYNGDVILPDGAHGHMFIGFTPPKADRDGCLQVGMETTAPGAASMVGYVHDSNSTEATANPESSFGGHKSDKIGDGSPRTVKTSKKLGTKGDAFDKDDWRSTNARYVDLNDVGQDGDWETYLRDLHGWYEEMKEAEGRDAIETLVGPKGGLEAARN